MQRDKLTIEEWKTIQTELSLERPSCDPLVAKVAEIVSTLPPDPSMHYSAEDYRNLGNQSAVAVAVNFAPEHPVSKLAHAIKEGMDILVSDGFIDENQAAERANNITMAIMGEFTFEPIND